MVSALFILGQGTLGVPESDPTCEVKNLCPLLADVDLDIRAPEGQVGTALVKDQ